MGYEALEVSDWIRLDFQVGNATVDFRFHWSILCPICGSYVRAYLLYIIFIWFSSGTRNCISSNLYLLVLEHNISRLSASCSKYVAVGPTLNQRLGFGWRMVISC